MAVHHVVGPLLTHGDGGKVTHGPVLQVGDHLLVVAGQAGVGGLSYLKLEEMPGSWVTRKGGDII